MSIRTRSLLALIVGAFGIAMIALLLASYLTDPVKPTTVEALGGIALVASLVAFVLSGAVILVRQPGNIMGWLLIIPGLTLPASELATRWLAAFEPPPDAFTPFTWLLSWWTNWSWLLLIFPIFHLLLVFPNGRVLTRRWRAAVVLELAMAGTLIGLAAFAAEIHVNLNGDAVWSLPNPIGFVPNDPVDAVFGVLWGIGLLVLTIVSALALVVRYRRGTVDEQKQLKWPLSGAMVFGLIYAGSAVEDALLHTAVIQSLLGFGLAAIPVTVAIAILRYRLYEIDRIVSRTIGWAIVTGILLATFVVPVLGLQAIVSEVIQGQTLLVAVSTLLAAALFQPVRGRVQRAVDRRFDRARYDGERVVAAFGERLRGHVELDALSGAIRGVASDTVRPASTAIWLRQRTR